MENRIGSVIASAEFKEAIWQINDNDGNKLGLLRTPDFLTYENFKRRFIHG